MMRTGIPPLACLLLAAFPAARAVAAEGPRVLLFYDMEGLSGVNRFDQTQFGRPGYPATRELLTADVNAAIRGLALGGAGSITVVDAHASGNSESPDILLEKLDKRARMDFRSEAFNAYRDGPKAGYDAIVCIGMHARANTRGFLAHTFTIEPSYKVNGTYLSETTLIALSAARFGTPVIMISSDDVLREQFLEQFPLGEYAVVKKARGRGDAELLPLDAAHANIEKAAQAAIRKLSQFRPYTMAAPYEFELSFQNREQTDRAMLYPGLERAGERAVKYTAADFIEGYDRSRTIFSLVTTERMSLLMRAVKANPEGEKILAEYRRLLELRWTNPEQFAEAPAVVKKQYYGAN